MERVAAGSGVAHGGGDHLRHPVDRYKILVVCRIDAKKMKQGWPAGGANAHSGEEGVAQPQPRVETVIG